MPFLLLYGQILRKKEEHIVKITELRDVLAIRKFGTIPERPVQSRPVRASRDRFGPAYIISKIYFN